ncbi:MAG: glycosyltransferase [bacterium]
MNVSYIVNARIPTEKAHGFQIMKVCEEFARKGVKTELVVPNRSSAIVKDPFSYYGIESSFPIRRLGVDVFRFQSLFGSITHGLQSLAFLYSLSRYTPSKETIIYTRNPEICWLFRLRGYRAVYNAHNWTNTHPSIFQLLTRSASGVVCNSFGTAKEFSTHGYQKVFVAPNGADVVTFSRITETKEVLRAQLGLALEKKIAMYVGHLYGWKGVDTVLAAAATSKDKNNLFVLVGGTETDVRTCQEHCVREGIDNILVLGHKERAMIPRYLLSADALLLPNVPTTKESENYTSPIKMFEYMASGVPIIASNLASIGEVLDDSTAYLVPPANPEAILTALHDIDPKAPSQRAIHAKTRVMDYTWDKHAEKVIAFLQTLA